ncbi:MAG: RNA-binding protein [Opitutales bacterium]|nr:RNA-binding protein [Opitutales bacterium]
MSTKIFVGNLNFQATEQELQDFLSSYGAVQEVFMPKDRESGRPRGFAFVTFEDDAAAQAALESLNGKEFAGRPLTVNEARAKEERSGPRPPRREFGSAPRREFGGDRGGSRGGFGGDRGGSRGGFGGGRGGDRGGRSGGFGGGRGGRDEY